MRRVLATGWAVVTVIALIVMALGLIASVIKGDFARATFLLLCLLTWFALTVRRLS